MRYKKFTENIAQKGSLLTDVIIVIALFVGILGLLNVIQKQQIKTIQQSLIYQPSYLQQKQSIPQKQNTTITEDLLPAATQGPTIQKSPLSKSKKVSPTFSAFSSDRDNDKIPNIKDNCPNKFNPNQRDDDGNGIGNVCDIGYKPSYLLDHRLVPGEQLKFTVDINKKLARTNKKVLGVSFFVVGDGPVDCRPGGQTLCKTGLPIDANGDYRLADYPSGNFEKAIKDLNLLVTRVYDFAFYDRFLHAGKESQAFYAKFDAKTALNKWHYLAQRLNIPEENIVIALFIYTDKDGNIYPTPNFWENLVNYSVSKGYRFKHWEIGNEVFIPIKEDVTGFTLNGFFNRNNLDESVAKFKNYFISVSKAIKKVQPTAQLGISIYGPANLINRAMDRVEFAWSKSILENLAGYYDFIVGHYYLGGENEYELADNNFERHVLLLNYALMQVELTTLEYARNLDGNKNRFIYHYDTEWGSNALRGRWGEGGGVASEVRNGNLFGSIARAIRLIYYLRENIVEGANTWAMLEREPYITPAFGLLTHNDPNMRSMTYWLYYYFNQFVGNWILHIQGTAPYKSEYSFKYWPWYDIDIKGPYTPVLASRNESGNNVYLIIANGNENFGYDFKVNFVNFQGSKVEGILFNDFRLTNWKDNNPFSTKQSDFITKHSLKLSSNGRILNGRIPEHSVLFVKITR